MRTDAPGVDGGSTNTRDVGVKTGRCATRRRYRDLFMNGVTVTLTAGSQQRVASRLVRAPV